MEVILVFVLFRLRFQIWANFDLYR